MVFIREFHEALGAALIEAAAFQAPAIHRCTARIQLLLAERMAVTKSKVVNATPAQLRRIDAGDKDADFYFDAMIYQIAKDIGGMATVMNGQVDRVILTGEIARSQRLVERLRRRVEFIAPVEVVPGAVEMDALVAGALRMLRGQEEIRDYDTERND